MSSVFVVMGTSGEYSDQMHWLVQAFYNQDEAQLFALALKQQWREAGRPNDESHWVHPLDPQFEKNNRCYSSDDPDGCDYTVIEVPLT